MAINDITAPGRTLHQNFLSLGDMTGKTSGEIIACVGNPSSISQLAGGQCLLQWQATGCHMALVFDADGRFAKISHQYAQYVPAHEVEKARKEEFNSVIIGLLFVAFLAIIFVMVKIAG